MYTLKTLLVSKPSFGIFLSLIQLLANVFIEFSSNVAVFPALQYRSEFCLKRREFAVKFLTSKQKIRFFWLLFSSLRLIFFSRSTAIESLFNFIKITTSCVLHEMSISLNVGIGEVVIESNIFTLLGS